MTRNPHLRSTTITSGAQIRAGRALLGATRHELAAATGLHRNAILYWEKHQHIPHPPEYDQPHACKIIAETFRLNGVVMVHEPGPGVALMPTKPTIDATPTPDFIDRLDKAAADLLAVRPAQRKQGSPRDFDAY